MIQRERERERARNRDEDRQTHRQTRLVLGADLAQTLAHIPQSRLAHTSGAYFKKIHADRSGAYLV